MAYSVEFKNQVIQMIKDQKSSIEDISKNTGIDLTTLNEWKDELEQSLEIVKTIEDLSANNELEKAFALGAQEKYQDDAIVQAKLVQLAITKKKNLDQAVQICQKNIFKHNPYMQSQLIKIYLINHNYEEASAIGALKEFKNNIIIQSQMITLAMKQGKFEEALKIGNLPKFKDIIHIQSQMISVYMILGKLDEALKIGNNPQFANIPEIQSQMMTIAILQNRPDDAIAIGTRNNFRGNRIMKVQLSRAYTLKDELKKAKKLAEKATHVTNAALQQSFSENDTFDKTEQLLAELKTKLYCNKVKQEDIELVKNSKILTDYQKQLILLAIYERQKNSKEISSLVKSYKAKFPNAPENKTFNTILQRALTNRVKIFNFFFYDQLLDWKFDRKLQEKYEKEDKELLSATRVPPSPVSNVKVVSQPTKKNIDTSDVYSSYPIPKKVVSGSKNNDFINSIKVSKPQPVVPKIPKAPKLMTHYDEILQYLTDKKKDIYIDLNSSDASVQKAAMLQWDKMDSLLDKVKQNKDNVDYLNTLYDKISSLKSFENSQER